MSTPTAPLADLVEIFGGGTPSKSKPEYFVGAIPWVTPKDMKEWHIVDSQDHISEDAVADSATKIVPKNSVLVVIRSGVLKHTLPIGIAGRPVAMNQDMKALVCGPGLEPRYLAYFLKSAEPQLLTTVRGTTADNIPMDELKALRIPQISIPEQRRIADILDKADVIRRKRKETIALTEELLRSAFLEMFGDPVTNPKGWPLRSIEQVAEVATGGTPSRSEPSNFGGGIPWVKTTEVRDGEILETEESISARGLASSNCRVFPVGSIVIAMYGQGATRGRTGVLGVPAATNQACAVIAPSVAYSTNYLWTLMNLSYERLRDLGRGGNQPNLNLSMIRHFVAPFPPREQQLAFDKIIEQGRQVSAKQRAQMRGAEKLFDSLVHRAFTGNLSS